MRSIGSVYVTVLANSKQFEKDVKDSARQAGDSSGKTYAKEFNKAFADIEKSAEFDHMAKKIAQDWEKIAKQNGTSLRHGLRDARLPKALEPQLEEMARKFGVTTDEIAQGIAERLGAAFREVEHDSERAAHAYSRAWDDAHREDKRRTDDIIRDAKRTEKAFVHLDGTFSHVFTNLRRSLFRMGSGGFFDGLTSGLGGVVGLFEIAAKGAESLGESILNLGKGGGGGGGILKAAGAMEEMGSAAGAGLASVGALVAVLFILETVAGAVAALISALAGGLVILGSAVSYALGYLIVFAPIIAALAASMGVLMLSLNGAFSAMGKFNTALNETDPKAKAEALKTYRKELDKLPASTRAFVRGMEPLLRIFDDLQVRVGEAFFKPFAAALGPLTKKGGPIDILAKGLVSVATALGTGVAHILTLTTTAPFLSAWADLWKGLGPITLSMTDALGGFIEGLVGFLGAITPFAQKLAGWFADIMTSFGAWATSAEGQNTIKTFMQDAEGAAKSIYDAIVAVGEAFAILFGPDGAQGSGQDFLTTVKELAEKFKTWVTDVSNDGRLKTWLDEAKETIGNILEAVKTLGTTFANLNTEKNRAFLNHVIDALDTALSVTNFLISAIETLWDWITKPFSWANSWLGNIGQSIANLPSQVLNGLRFGAAGAITNGPMIAGEAGPEAIIPLTRPLSMIDPSVRGMAALIRGESTHVPITAAGGKTVNANITVVSPSADPAAVAAHVLNRAVVLTR